MSITLRHTLSLVDQYGDLTYRQGKIYLEDDSYRSLSGFVERCKVWTIANIQEDLPHTITSDFSYNTVGGGTPSDWTAQWDVSEAVYDVVNYTSVSGINYLYNTGPNLLYVNPSSLNRIALSCNRVGAAKDFDVCGHFLVPYLTSGTYPFYFHVRGQGSQGSETAYRLVVGEGTPGTTRISKYVSGSSSDLVTTSISIYDEYGYFFRFQVKGNTLKAKIWRDVDIEPFAWLLETTDTDIINPGWFGFGQSDTDDYYIDWVSVGLNGAEPDSPQPLHTGSYIHGIVSPYTGDLAYIDERAVAVCGYVNICRSRKLKSVRIFIYTSHAGQARVGIYKGGLPEDPSGATLVEDLGVTSGTDTSLWYEIESSTNPWIDPGELLWVVTKTADTALLNVLAADNDYEVGSLYSLSYYQSTALTLDKTSAYPATWPSDSGSFTTGNVLPYDVVFFPLLSKFSTSIAATSSVSEIPQDGFGATLFNTSLSVSTSTSSVLLDNAVSGSTDFSEYPEQTSVALYDFESGALTTDSKGSNTLVASGSSPTADTGDYKEGSASSAHDRTNVQYYYVTDTNLDTGFPFKNGGSVTKFSICGWFKLDSTQSTCTIVGKQGAATASFWICADNTDFELRIYQSGWQNLVYGTSLQTGRWYHFGCTYDASDQSYRVRIWDDTAGALLGTDLTGTSTKTAAATADSFYIGTAAGMSSHCFDGNIDKVVVFSDVLSADEIDTVRKGGYDGTAAPTRWTEFWDTDGFQTTVIEHASSQVLGPIGTKCLYWEGSISSRRALLWDDSQGFYNGGVLTKVKIRSDTADDDQTIRIHLRSGGTEGSENSIQFSFDDTTMYISSYVGGSAYSIVTVGTSAFANDTSNEYWVRFEAEGSAVRAKLWNYDHPEPYDWSLTGTLGTGEDPGPGYAGIGSYGNADFECDYFAFYGGSATQVEVPYSSYFEDSYFGSTGTSYANNAAVNSSRAMGGYLTQARNLTGVRMYKTGTGTGSIRFAVYLGGSSSGPTGATLLHDFGETSVTATDGYWVTATTTAKPIPRNTWIWVCYKSNDNAFNFSYIDGNIQHGNYQYANGRSDIGAAGISTDETVAYPSTMPSGATYAAFWYQLEAIFESRADIEFATSISAVSTESNPNLAGDVFFDLAVSASSSTSKAILGDTLIIINPDAETGDATGWTKDHGSGTVPSIESVVTQGFGSYTFAVSSDDSSAGYYQDIDIPTEWIDRVDTGAATATLSAALWGYSSGNDPIRMLIEAYSSTTTVNETTYLSRWHDVPSLADRPTWIAGGNFYRVQAVLPEGTRLLRIEVEGVRTAGTVLNGYADEFKLQLGIGRQRHEIPIVNPGIDVSDTTGWTTDNFAIRSTIDNNIPVPSGDFFYGGAAATSYLEQTVDIPSYLYDFIDDNGQGGATRYEETDPVGTESIIFHFDAMMGSWDNYDDTKVTITFMTEDSEPLGSLTADYKAYSQYLEYLDLRVVPPQNTRKIKIRFDGDRDSGTNLDSYVLGMAAYFTTAIHSLKAGIGVNSSTSAAVLDNTYRNYGWEYIHAEASSESSEGTNPGNAFAYPVTLSAHYFQSAYTGTPFNIDVELTESREINAYSIMAISTTNDVPEGWTLYGSDTGAYGGEEDTLDTQSLLTWTDGEKKLFTFSNSTDYKYYRFAFVQTTTTSFEIQEIKLLGTDSRQGDRRYGLDTDIAYGGTATATSSQGDDVPGNAIDHDYSTSWWAGYNTTPPKYWQVELSEAKTARRIVIRTRTASQSPADFDVLGSNTGAFTGEETTLLSVTSSTDWGNGDMRHFNLTTTGSFLYYRVEISSTQGSYYALGDVYLLEGVPVALEMAGSLAAASSTSSATLDRNYEFSSAISAASETSEVGIEIVSVFDTLITTDTSVGNIIASITRDITCDIAATSSINDIETGVIRDLTGAFSTQSSTQDIFLDPGRFFASTIAASSSTSPAETGVVRELAQEIAAASEAGDISFNPDPTFSSVVGAASETSDITITTAAELVCGIAASSSTNNITLFTEKAVDDATLTWPIIHAETQTSSPALEVAGDIDLLTTIAASSQTSPAHLSGPVDFASSVAAASSTLSSELGILRPLTAAATAVSSTASNVTLAVEREVTSSASAGSITADVGLAIARDVSASIEAVSVTTQAILSAGINYSTSIDTVTSTEGIALAVLRELYIDISAESSVSQPVITVFTEDPTDDEIIAQARNYRVVIPAASLSGTGNQIRILFRAHSAQDTAITASAFGQRLGSTVDYASGHPTRITFNEGNNATTVLGGTEQWSDWIDFDLDDAEDHLVHVFINATPHYYVTKDQAGPTYIRSGAINDTMVTDVTDAEYSSSSKHYHVVSIEARTTADIGVTRELTTSMSAASDVGDIRVGEDIVFDQNIAAASSAGDITLGVELPMAGIISSSSLTSEVDLYYPLASSIAASSVAGDISVLLSVDIDFASSMAASTSASEISLDRNYEFVSSISADSDVSSAELGIVTEIQFAASLDAGSDASDASMVLSREVSASIQAASITSDITADIYTEYQLSTSVSADSEVGSIDMWVSYVLDLSSELSAVSSTEDAGLGVIRPASCSIDSTSSVDSIVLIVDHSFVTVISITTETADAIPSLEMALSSSIQADSEASIVNLLLYAPFFTTIAANSQTEPILFMLDLLPLIIDTRIFSETAEREWVSTTADRVWVSSTAVRTYESETKVLEIENRTGTEVYSIPYEAKPYPFST